MDGGSVDDVFAWVVEAASLLHPRDLPAVAGEAAARLGGRDLTVHLSDLGQDVLSPFGHDGEPGELEIDGTVAGRAFRSGSTVAVGQAGGGTRLWAPMLDGAERVGVLGVTVDEATPETIRTFGAFTGLLTELLLSAERYGDDIVLSRRRRPLPLATELRWSFVPPLTFQAPGVHLAGVLEPAYEIAGDVFDYAIAGDVLHVAIADAMGHGLEATRIGNLLLGAYRHSRRAGASLTETHRAIDDAIAESFGPDRFATGSLCRLHVGTGRLEHVRAGHPAALLLRGHRFVGELDAPVVPPFGIGGGVDAPVGVAQLEPGDRVILYTDGVVESRRGAPAFGVERLVDFVERASAADEQPAETVRRLAKAVVAHHGGELHDDASLLLVRWDGPPGPTGVR